MIEVRTLSPAQLDFATFVALQKVAFAEVMAGTGLGDIVSEPYYRWKYASPEGDARIALVCDDGRPVAANSMFPMRVHAARGAVRAWQSCDTATLPEARGRGHFMRCLEALRAELGTDEVFFGFPNRNSTRGLFKLGWQLRGEVDAFVRIWPGGRMERFGRVAALTSFGAEQDAFAAALRKSGGPLLDRGSAYMNWRYFGHPLYRYACFAWREAGQQAGLLVMRRIDVSGRSIAVVMELLALDSRIAGELISVASAWAATQDVRYAMILNNTTTVAQALSRGFVPIPKRVLPKRQVLMGAANGPESGRIWNLDWRVQIGDWDGF